MKLIHISNFHEVSGWSSQAVNHILALDLAGVEVVPRRINITGVQNPNLPARILELEKQSDSKPDIIVLNTLPNLYERIYGPKYVGFYLCETNNFRASGWQSKINLMDSAIVCCYHNKESSINSGVKKPINVVPLAVDIEKLKQPLEPHDVRKAYPNDFIIYTVGDISHRKNVATILKAFHTEFSPNEPVQLFIKTTPAGLGDNYVSKIDSLVGSVKSGLKLYRNIHSYKKEIIVCDYAPEDKIIQLHQSANCFVSASHCEAFCIPAAEALAVGNIVIAPNYGGFTEYLNDKNSYLVGGKEDNVFGAVDTLPDLYTAQESWYYPSIRDIRQAMRSAYEKKDLNKKKIEQAQKDVVKLSLRNVGEKYKKVLESL